MTHGVSLGAGYWLEMIERQRESQLSIDEFCRRRRISVHTFRSWKRRLAENATAPTFRELIVAESLGGNSADDRPATLTTGDAIEIVLSASVVVRVPIGAASLAEILRQAKEIAC